jgi:hypothetical protein
MTVSSRPGEYVFQSSGGADVCGFYMVAEANQVVEVEIEMLDVKCGAGLIAVSHRVHS